MNKNIIICSDGTGNTTVKDRGTNVFKLFEAVDLNEHKRNPQLTAQIAFYDDGVGTQRFNLLRKLSGAFGWGLGHNVRNLYAILARVYNPGDKIFLFGFSRGAFTVRTLAGLIASTGIVDIRQCDSKRALTLRVIQAYELYRLLYLTVWGEMFVNKDKIREKNKNWRAKHTVEEDTPIHFIGVWDTVDAVGFPIDYMADFVNTFIYRYKFPDTKLCANIRKACHALSIDDERHTFHPLLWEETPETKDRIEQVWFPGVHSNVGGGYPKQGLSLVAMDWMMSKAQAEGLRPVPEDRKSFSDHQSCDDKLYDSRAGLGSYYRYMPRDIGRKCAEKNVIPKIHISAIERIVHGTDDYAPGNIPVNSKVITITNRTNTAAIEQIINQGLVNDGCQGSLLDKVGFYIGIRRITHIIYFILTFYAIIKAGELLADDHTIFGKMGGITKVFSISGLSDLAKKLFDWRCPPEINIQTLQFWNCLAVSSEGKYVVAAIGIIIAVYLVGLAARARMQDIFMHFWHRQIQLLRNYFP